MNPFAKLGLPTQAEANEATKWLEQLGPDLLIEHAALRVFCIDCARTIAAVTYVDRRALVTWRALDDRLAPERRLGRHWQSSWLNRGSVVFCNARQYVLGKDGLRQRVPPAGRRRAPDFKVSHTLPDAVL